MGFVIHQHESALDMHVSPPSSNFPPHRHPSRLSYSTNFGFPALYSKFPLAIYFTYGNIYVSKLFSSIIPLSPFPKSKMSVSTLLPCK